MMIFLLIIAVIFSSFFSKPVWAISDPREVPNNKIGIGILSPEAEIEEVSKLVNNNGDWGWVLVIIKKDERDVDRWQNVMNLFTKHHLVPIVRLATKFTPEGNWEKPAGDDADLWADFLYKLSWPTKNRYVQIYNEVNNDKEWGGDANAAEYASVLSQTIDKLKAKSDDFFVLASPLDSALKTSSTSISEDEFLQSMETSDVDIFNKVDGWASHSYPNPDFSANPLKSGRLGLSGYKWELNQVSKFTNKDFGVFITETGWRRSENGLDENKIAEFYKTALEKVWNSSQVVAVIPFIYSYSDDLYYQFSFKKMGTKDEYFKYYFTLKDFQKTKGVPQRINQAQFVESALPTVLLQNSTRAIKIKIKNTGNYIWDSENNLMLAISGTDIKINQISWDRKEIFPGQEITARLIITTGIEGEKRFSLKAYDEKMLIWEGDFQTETVSLLSYVVQNITKNLAIPLFASRLTIN